MTIERVFDELIGLQRAQPTRNWRACAIAWAGRLTGNMATGLAIGIGMAIGRALAG